MRRHAGGHFTDSRWEGGGGPDVCAMDGTAMPKKLVLKISSFCNLMLNKMPPKAGL